MLKETIVSDLTTAMKQGDTVKRSTLRMLLAAMHNTEIDRRKKDIGLSDQEVVEVVRAEVKKRHDAAQEFEKGGRGERAEEERAEAVILSSYLPPDLSEHDLARIVEEGIRAVHARAEKDFGAVMKQVVPLLKGRTSGDRISAAVRAALAERASSHNGGNA